MKRCYLLLFILSLTIVVRGQKTEDGTWYVDGYSEEYAKSYFDSRYSLDVVEGIWQSNDGFKYSIEKDVENGQRIQDKFRVVVLESSFDGWKPSEIKGFISYSSVNGIYSLKYYTKNATGKDISSQNVIIVVDNPLLLSFNRIDGAGEVSLFKLYPQVSNPSQAHHPGNSAQIERWSGSSIAIGVRYVATNFHVVDGAKTLSVSGVRDNYSVNYNAEVVAIDKSMDLAVLKITDSSFAGFDTPCYDFSTNTVDVGTDVFVLGYPLTKTMGEDIKLTTGVVSSKTGFQGDVSTYQISAPIQPGNSGGPLFDSYGNLIGIVNAKHIGAENVGYAIKLVYLKNLIESCNDKMELNSNNTIHHLSLTEKVKKLTPYVCIVRANYTDETSIIIDGNIQKQENEKVSAEKSYAAAKQFYEENKLDEAFGYAQQSVGIMPNNENQYLLAVVAHRLNKYKEALSAIQYCIDNKYMEKQSLEIKAWALMQLEDYKEAWNTYNKLTTLDRKNVYAIYNKAECSIKLSNYTSAIGDFEQLLMFEGVIDFDYATVYNNIAYCYLKMDDYSNSESYLKKAIEVDKRIGYIWDTYGELAYKLERFEDCVTHMTTAIYLDKNNHSLSNSYYYRGLALGKLGFEAGALCDFESSKSYGNTKVDSLIDSLSTNNNGKSRKFYKIIKSPYSSGEMMQTITLFAVELTEESTTLFFENHIDNSMCINKESYILHKGVKYYLMDAQGISYYPTYTDYSAKHEFYLTFPALPQDATFFDMIESPADSNGWVLQIDLSKTGAVRPNITWNEVYVTDEVEDAKGLEPVESITKTSGWGGTAASLGRDNAIKMLRQEAARKGCCMVVITDIRYGLTTKATGILYRIPYN